MASELDRNVESDASQTDRVDPYGFKLSEELGSYEKMMDEYVAILSRRATKWSKLLQGKAPMEKSTKVKRYVRKGVPSEHRSRIWMASSGAQEKLERNPGYYRSLLTTQHDARLEETIRIDLHRTFPDNVQFRDSTEPCLQNALYNVLLAYGHHNQAVGYCQGMNFIAGYLIIITKDEEKSFWLMEALLDRILPDYYSPPMLGLKTDQAVLFELLRMKVPSVWQTLASYPDILTLVCSRWFICLFIDVLPVETVLRIWDCLFYEGSKVLFRVALTLVQTHQGQIQAARSLTDVCQSFKEIPRGDATLNPHAFMQKVFTEPGRLPKATIAKLRQTCREHVEAEENKLSA